MVRARGRRTTAYALAASIVLLGGAGAAFRRPIIERYWLWRFHTTESAEKEEAARRLAAMGSLEAIPIFLEEQSGRHSSDWAGAGLRTLLETGDERVLRAFVKCFDHESLLVAGEAADALAARGKDAVPFLLDGLGDRRASVRAWSAYALGRTRGDAAVGDALAILAREDEDAEVRESARRAIERLAIAPWRER